MKSTTDKEMADNLTTIEEYLRAAKDHKFSDAKIVRTLRKAFRTGDWYIVPRPKLDR